MAQISRLVTILVALFAMLDVPFASAQDRAITVFAAASMKNALDDINAAFTRSTGVKVAASYAASSALMKQIEQGAPADVFASADLDWMDYGSQKKVIKDETRLNLLGNRLVLIAPKDSKLDNVTIGPGFDLAPLAGDGRIATGDVQAVPIGKYAKAALEKLGSWNAAAAKFAMTENVRAALTLVARGEAPLGIVYATDAKVEPSVNHWNVPRGLSSSNRVSRCCNRDSKARGGRLPILLALSGCQGGIRAVRLHLSYPARLLSGYELIPS